MFEPGTFVLPAYRPAIWAIVVQQNVCVKMFVLFSILDESSATVTCSCVPKKRVSQGLEHGRNPYSESELVFFRIHANQKKFRIFCQQNRLRFRCKPGVSCSWMEFDFYLAIGNSRSFKTIICSTNSSSHSQSRDAEHIRLTEQLFVGAVTKSQWRGLVWKLKIRCRQKL